MKTIFFPGWAMPADKNFAKRLLPPELSPLEIAEYGFFSGEKKFDFQNPNNEIANFAKSSYDVAVGYSLGSQFAMRLATHPSNKKLKALILISAFAKFAESKDNPDGQKSSEIKAMILGMRIQPSMVLKKFYRVSLGSSKSELASDSLIPVPSLMISALEFLLNCDFRKSAGNIEVPTLIIAGSDDTVVKTSLSKKLADTIKDAKFVLEKNCGHSLPFTKREEIGRIIHDFLKNII